MVFPRSFFRSICVFTGLVWVSLYSSPSQALTPNKIKELQEKAQQFETSADWGKACTLYAKILEQRRNHPGIKDRYIYCLRRYFQDRRHNDPSYHKEVLTLGYPQAVRLNEFILIYLSEHALDPEKVSPKRLFHKGLEEFANALTSKVFISAHLNKIAKSKIDAFRDSISSYWKNQPVDTVSQVVGQIQKLALAARQQLKLKLTTTLMEFTCGCCYSVDDYTMYLTPLELRGLCNTLKTELVGVGLKLGIRGDKLVITSIASDSPGADVKPPLAKNDQVLSVDGKTTGNLPPEVAMDLLFGEPGTSVELVVHSSTLGTRLVTLQRRNVFVPSVEFQLKPGGIGYILIRNFQTSTVQELDNALTTLVKSEIKALVLDLRGNSGGIFPSAVEVARRFLPNGVIVSTQTLDPKQNVTYYSQNAAALTLPLVVMVDGNTASAAEILAGALKENGRAKLVGLPTYGKGCIQEVYSLTPSTGVVFPGGLRLTVSRFLSPNGSPYGGQGIEPNILADKDPCNGSDGQMEAALKEAERLLEEAE